MIYLISLLMLFITGACSSSQPNKTVIPCTHSSKISFQDPLEHEFVLVSSDTFSDNDQQWLIYRTYKSKEDTLRYFTTSNDEMGVVDCSKLDNDHSMDVETDQLYKLYGIRSINEKFHYKKDNTVFDCVRFNKNNYIIGFCRDSNYVRMELYNFCNGDEFRGLLESLEFE
jgi:hypothetical protein